MTASMFRALASWWKGEGDDRDGTTHGREKADKGADGQTYSAVSPTDQVKQGGTRKRPLPPSYADLFGDEEGPDNSSAIQSRKRPAAQCQPKSVRLQPRQQKWKPSRLAFGSDLSCNSGKQGNKVVSSAGIVLPKPVTGKKRSHDLSKGSSSLVGRPASDAIPIKKVRLKPLPRELKAAR
jgi:hypothetical protein